MSIAITAEIIAIVAMTPIAIQNLGSLLGAVPARIC